MLELVAVTPEVRIFFPYNCHEQTLAFAKARIMPLRSSAASAFCVSPLNSLNRDCVKEANASATTITIEDVIKTSIKEKPDREPRCKTPPPKTSFSVGLVGAKNLNLKEFSELTDHLSVEQNNWSSLNLPLQSRLQEKYLK